MTDRERWTVYPLLILALGLALRDKLLLRPAVDASQVTCRQLIVKGPNGTDVLRMGSSTDGGGRIDVYGKAETANVIIEASDGGGSVSTLSDTRQTIADLGHDGEGNGHLVVFGQGKQIVGLGDDDHNSGKVVVFGPDKHACVALTVDPENRNGRIRTFNIKGTEQIILESANGGGRIFTVNDDKKPLIAIRHDGAGSGSIYLFDANGAGYPVVFARTALPRAPDVRPPADEAPETSSPDSNPQPDPKSDANSDSNSDPETSPEDTDRPQDPTTPKPTEDSAPNTDGEAESDE